MCGGDAPVFDRVKPVIQAYAKMQNLMGPAGSGQLTKMMNQICIAGLVQGLSEALAFGRASGLDLVKAVEVIRSEEHTSELQSLMRISYAVFCLKKKNKKIKSGKISKIDNII